MGYGRTDQRTNGRTDGRMDGRTDKASNRDAWTHLEMLQKSNVALQNLASATCQLRKSPSSPILKTWDPSSRSGVRASVMKLTKNFFGNVF